jgi:pimeloyl-ACP methyl ester carboxylesterase
VQCRTAAAAYLYPLLQCIFDAGLQLHPAKPKQLINVVLAALQVMYDADMRKLLPSITCPALLVVGEQDQM